MAQVACGELVATMMDMNIVTCWGSIPSLPQPRAGLFDGVLPFAGLAGVQIIVLRYSEAKAIRIVKFGQGRLLGNWGTLQNSVGSKG